MCLSFDFLFDLKGVDGTLFNKNIDVYLSREDEILSMSSSSVIL
jgi:hypothetical protein